KAAVDQRRIINFALKTLKPLLDERWFDAFRSADSDTLESIERTGRNLESRRHLAASSSLNVAGGFNARHEVAPLFVEVLQLALRCSKPPLGVDVFGFLENLCHEGFARKDDRTYQLDITEVVLNTFFNSERDGSGCFISIQSELRSINLRIKKAFRSIQAADQVRSAVNIGLNERKAGILTD